MQQTRRLEEEEAESDSTVIQRAPKGFFGEGVFHRAPQVRRNLAETGGAKPLGGPSWKTPSPKTPFGTLQFHAARHSHRT